MCIDYICFLLSLSEGPQVDKNTLKMIYYYTILQNCYLTVNVTVAAVSLHSLAHAPGPRRHMQGRATGVPCKQAASYLPV